MPARLLTVLVAAFTLQAVPAAAHPNGARVPPGTRLIAIHSATGVSVRVTKPAEIRQIVAWFDALPRFVPRPCPYPVRKPPTVTFVFEGKNDSFLGRAVDHLPGACSSMIEFTNDGQVKYAPLADDGFVARVARLLGVDLGSRPTTAENRRAARRAAAKLLRLVTVPAGARSVAKPPVKALGSAASTPGTSELVDRHRIWKVHESVDKVFAFEHGHRPAGSRLTGTGTSDYGPNPSEDLVFSFPPLAGRLASRELDVNMVPLPNGWTGIRADAQVVWVVVRPPRQVLPAGRIDSIVVVAPRLTRTVTDPARVAKIVRWFDALPIVQPGGLYACPAIAGPSVRFAFAGADGTVLARADVMYLGGLSTPCNPIRWSVGGHRKTALVGGRFLRRVESLLGERLG